MGADTGADLGSGRVGGHHRHWSEINRLLRQIAVRGDRGNRPYPRLRQSRRPAPAAPSRCSTALYPRYCRTFAGVGVFRWDINIRESTILGLVGAGGIGLELNGSINTLAWTQVSTILLVIFVTVLISEWVSAKVRGAII